MFGFLGLKIVFWVLFAKLGGLLIPFSFQAIFNHISPCGNPCHFCSAQTIFATASLRAQVSSILPSPSTLSLFTSGYTAV